MRQTGRMLAGHRDLRLVLGAGVISLSGDWVLTIGLVYALTGSTADSALTAAASFAPRVLLGAVAGVFADRWDRRRTMIVADLLLAAGLLPLLLVHSAAQVWIVFAVMFAEGSVQQFFSPAEQAMVPRLVPDEDLPAANALNGQVSNVSRLVGSALGGVIAAGGGIIAVTLTDAASFVASAAFLACVRTSGRTAAESAGGPVRTRLARIGNELRDGLRLTVRNRVLRALMIFALVTSIGEGIMSTLVTPFVEHVLHGTSQEFGLVVAAQAVGGIAGIPGALCLAGLMRLFQRSSEDSYRGRVSGAISTLEGVTTLAGTLGAGYLSRLTGIIAVLAVQGAGYVVGGLAMLSGYGIPPLSRRISPGRPLPWLAPAPGQASLARGNASLNLTR